MTHQPNIGREHCACGAYPGGLCDGWCYGACGLSHWDELELRKQLAAKTAECERLRESQQEISAALGVPGCDAAEMLNVIDSIREDAGRFRREADNLARMLRRGQWLAKKETGDTGLKVWAGQAYDLLDKYGRLGSPLRGKDAARKETP